MMDSFNNFARFIDMNGRILHSEHPMTYQALYSRCPSARCEDVALDFLDVLYKLFLLEGLP